MSFAVRLLGAGDEAALEVLAREDADFDVDDRGHAHEAPREHARAFLADANVLCWACEQGGAIVGFLHCTIVRKRDGVELLLYEIGVRRAERRRGVGRALVAAMDEWMRAHDVHEAWVLADNDGAVAFYRACGFAVSDDTAVYMTRA